MKVVFCEESGLTDVEFVRALGEWKRREGPAYRRLADAIRSAIDSGEVHEGERVPAERRLAALLRISRTTVVGAYDRLRQGSWLESRQGSGTRARRPDREIPKSLPADAASARVYRVFAEARRGTVEFLGAHLPGTGAVGERLTASAPETLEAWAREPGYFPLGVPELRRSIAAYLSRAGLPTSEEQVLVTNGAQQAIGLTAALFVRRGDGVVVEDPTYLGAIDIFHAAGARLLPAPVGKDGVRVEVVRDAMRGARPKLVYVMPTFQNPTGSVLPERQRRQLAKLSEETRVPLLEDNTLADLALEGEPPPPIAAFSRAAPVLTIGSLSKLFWGGLRIGWIRASEAMISRLAPIKTMADLGSSVLSQAAAIRLFRDVDRIRALRRREIGERLGELERALARSLPSWSFTRPAGGLSLWVKIPHGSAAEFARIALRHGVSVLPGNLASPQGRFGEYLRLPFVLEPKTIREGVDRLARAWEDYAPAPERERRVGVLV